MYTYCKKYGNRVLLRDHEDIHPKIITRHDWNLYFRDSKGEYTNIYGKPLRKDTFSTIREASTAIEQNKHFIKIYGAKNFGYQYIRDIYLNKEPITPKDIYIANIDIETGRDEQGYSNAEDARCPITSITLHNIMDDVYTVWGYHPDGYKPKQDNIRYVNCKNEEILLRNFINFINARYPDIITGWNVERYDIPYIINRTKKIIDDDFVLRLSPFNLIQRNNQIDEFNNEIQIYQIIGISILDYLSLFKKFTYQTPENYKLNTVAHMILGDKKIDYSEYANLQDLYNRNYELFIDYNIQDVRIVTRLDNKLKLFELILSVAYKAGINYNDVLSPVTTWDVLIYNNIMNKKMVPVYEMPNNKSGQYVGAYVKEPIPGMYNWVISCDLNSLYPHLQMGINISPEKRVADKDLPDELLSLRRKLGATTEGIRRLTEEKVDTSILRKYDVSLAPNGQFYKRDNDGFIPVILEELYAERKAVKRSMLEDKQRMEDDPSIDLTNQIAAKNTLQMALKILMNSEYGALGNQYFRYFDLRNAEAVTSSGQLAILWVAKYLNIFLNSILNTKDSDYVIAIDTDSVYLNLEHLVDYYTPKNASTEQIVDILNKWASDILEPKIKEIYDRLAIYVNAHKQKMVMAREVIANKGFWTGKKRYALNVYDNEGVRYHKPKTKIMGLECVRSSVPEFCRNYIKEVIVKILTCDEIDVQDFIIDIKNEFMDQPPEEISFPRGTNNIEKWIEDEKVRKGCPIHVRGCIVYNQYLDKIKSTDERIQSGDKIKYCLLKMPNIFGSHVISYPPVVNVEIYQEIIKYIDYEKQWEGAFYKPVKSMMECVGWTGERINRLDDFCQGEEY
jgi:DNA polymerase elongation subunit (family B)